MYIQDLQEILKRKNNKHYFNNIRPLKNSIIYYLTATNKNDFDYIALNVNKRVVAIYNYNTNTLIVESEKVDKNGHAIGCYDKKTARELNKFIDFIKPISCNHEQQYYKIINFVFFKYYLDNEYKRLVDNL